MNYVKRSAWRRQCVDRLSTRYLGLHDLFSNKGLFAGYSIIYYVIYA